MKKMLLAAALIASSLAVGCGGPCDELEDKCGQCAEPLRTNCQNLVTTARAVPITGSQSCQAALNSGAYNCD